MNYLDFEVLKNRNNGFTEEEREGCFGLLEQLIKLKLIAQEEGLLAMEVYANELKEDEAANRCYKDAILYMVDGNDPNEVEMFLSNDVVFYGADTFHGYLCYLIMKGILSIQEGDCMSILKEKLRHCIPFFMREEACERMDKVIAKYWE